MKVILASNNQNKIREMREILAPTGWEILSMAEAGIHADPDENGETFEENSLIKARCIMELSGMPAIADDSGITVDALDGAPGVHSARYGGEAYPTDYDRNLLLLRNMDQVPDGARGAQFVDVITMACPDGTVISARGELPGEILRDFRGDGGFGYDPLFYIPEAGCTMAELSAEKKNEISHRARALRAFLGKVDQNADK